VTVAWLVGLRRPVSVGLTVAVVLTAAWFGLEQIGYVDDIDGSLLLALIAVAASTSAFVTAGPVGKPIVINPAVSFSFAILLLWGFWPGMVAQTAAVVTVMWRYRLSVLRAALTCVQFVVGFATASAVLTAGGVRTIYGGEYWNGTDHVAMVFAAIGAGLATYTATSLVLVWAGRRLAWLPVSTWGGSYLELFKASLVVLSPLLAVAEQTNTAFVPLGLVPLVAVQRLARLSAERERDLRLDPLTHLANRRLLRERFEQLAGSEQAGARQDRQVALVLLDLDRFKGVNDCLGHHVGDQLLVAVAERISSVGGDQVTVSRLGGDEFAILASVDGPEAAAELAHRVAGTLQEPVTLDGLSVDVTASVGVALRRDRRTDDFATLLQHADTAMYEAKRNRDAIAVYSPRPDPRQHDRLRLLADLRRAIAEPVGDELVLHYQPQARLDTGVLDGLEALLRWTHPVHGLIDTRTIIDVAEHTSVMRQLTVRVIDEVVAQVGRWAAAGSPLRVSINISARDLYGDHVIERLTQRLDEHRVAPRQIQLEVTESALMADPDRARSTLCRIADLGIGISLDDFGTGYSSLQHLRQLPLVEIKVDRAFVAGMTTNYDDSAIVACTVEMAHALRLRTVAEGVGDEATVGMLRGMGCDLGQGWHIARPMPASRITDVLLGTGAPVDYVPDGRMDQLIKPGA
jgi:diguanylate cyclase (GGDEF)-like protein